MAVSAVEKTVLVADIGGTNSRFALFALGATAVNRAEGLCPENFRLIRKARFSTQDSRDTTAMMQRLVETPGDDGGFFTPLSPVPAHVDAAVFAIPGPTIVADPAIPAPRDDIRYCPNVPWPFEAATIAASLGNAPVRLINDFVANGFACAFLPRIVDAVTVLEGVEQPGFPRAVIGAGTGLGQCLILPGRPPMLLGSEGGHALFSFMGEEELALANFMAGKIGTPYLDGDMTLAGPALSYIYAFYTGETVHPRDVPPLAAKNAQVLAMAAKLYGRAVRHYAMFTLALGGVFVTGGLAASLPEVLAHPAFVSELKGSETMPQLLASLPVWHVRNGDTGLWGAAACAAYMVG